MAGKRIGYKRVSTSQQSFERQLPGMELDKEYLEVASGAKTERPKLKEMMDYMRDGDIIYVHSLDRLGRNATHTISTIEKILEKEVSLVFVNENLTLDPNSNDPLKKMFITFFSYFAEIERNFIAERTEAGRIIAKNKGAYKGKQPRHKPEQRLAIAKAFENRNIEKFDKAKFLADNKISATLLWRYRKEYEKYLTEELLRTMNKTMQLNEASTQNII